MSQRDREKETKREREISQIPDQDMAQIKNILTVAESFLMSFPVNTPSKVTITLTSNTID